MRKRTRTRRAALAALAILAVIATDATVLHVTGTHVIPQCQSGQCELLVSRDNGQWWTVGVGFTDYRTPVPGGAQ